MVETYKLNITASTEKEFKELREAYSTLLHYFVIKADSNIFIRSTRPSPRNLENKITALRGKGVEILPEKDKKLEIFDNGSEKDIPIYWFHSNQNGLDLGIGKEKDKKYFFEIYYSNKKE